MSDSVIHIVSTESPTLSNIRYYIAAEISNTFLTHYGGTYKVFTWIFSGTSMASFSFSIAKTSQLAWTQEINEEPQLDYAGTYELAS